jgi:rhodanese-related sulfurtransferase
LSGEDKQTLLRRRPDAVQVIPGLWVGSVPDRHQAERLVAGGIDCVVDLRSEAPSERCWPDATLQRQVPLVDHGAPAPDELREAAQAVVDLMRQGREVLVHCRAGIERAPTVACAALVLMGWPLQDAHRRVIEARPDAAPTPGQLAALRELAAQQAAPELET